MSRPYLEFALKEKNSSALINEWIIASKKTLIIKNFYQYFVFTYTEKMEPLVLKILNETQTQYEEDNNLSESHIRDLVVLSWELQRGPTRSNPPIN